MTQIPKIVKILISVLIAVAMAISSLKTGFNVRSEAVAPIIIEVVKEVIVQLLKGAAISAAGTITHYGITEGTEAFAEWVAETEETLSFATSALEYENGVELEVIGGTGEFSTEGVVRASLLDTSSMTDDEKMFAEFFVDYVNSNSITVNTDYNEAENTVANGSVLTVKGYEGVKNAVTNAYNNYLFEKAAQNEKINAAVNLEQALLDGNMPQYNFDFVGPSPTLDLGTISTNGAFTRDGYYHSLPITIDPTAGDSYYYYINEAQYSILENTNKYNNSNYPLTRALYLGSNGYYDRVEYGQGSYNCSQYILYDGKIYYACTDNAYYEGGSQYNGFGYKYDWSYYRAVDGTVLTSTSFNPSEPFQMGFVANTGGTYKSANPTYVAETETNTIAAPSEEDFTTTTGGVLGLPFTAAETAIGNALNLGLLNPDSTLSLDENGEIVAADGIEIAKLQELAELLAEGNLQFEDIQQYLDLISKLVSAGNMTETEQKAILDNINTQAKAQTKSLAEIEAAIKALSIDKEIELEDVEFDTIIVEHTGLTEAENLVKSALPIVEQSKQLLMNILNQAEAAPDYVPNFSFYWDSNKDGVTEKYTALDLSFMELSLTNENLEDKNRFAEPMTVREFIQMLIAFIVYITCLVKILKRISGLIDGSESSDNEIKSKIN